MIGLLRNIVHKRIINSLEKTKQTPVVALEALIK